VEIVTKSISSLLGVGKKQLLAHYWGWGKKLLAQHSIIAVFGRGKKCCW